MVEAYGCALGGSLGQQARDQDHGRLTVDQSDSLDKTERAITTAEFDAVIFDLDGVVTHTASVHARAWKRVLMANRATTACGVSSHRARSSFPTATRPMDRTS
jgi:hypothetical protein